MEVFQNNTQDKGDIKMKKQYPLLLICALLLTGCSRAETSSDVNVSSVATTAPTSETTTSEAEHLSETSSPQTNSPAAQTYTQQDIISALNSYGKFYRDYIYGSITADITDQNDTITADDNIVLHRVTTGEIIDRPSLFSALRSVMTDTGADNTFDEYNGSRFAISDGALYLAPAADICAAPYSELCLTFAEDAGEKLLVTLTAYDDSENFKDYNITLVKTADGLRADENVTDSCTSILSQLCVQDAPAESPLKSERAQLRRLLCDYGTFYRDYLNAKKTRKLIDSTDCITEGNTNFCRVAYGDITTEEEMLAAMRKVATDELIDAELMNVFSNIYRVSDGNIYLSEYAGYDGTVLGMDEVWLNETNEQDGIITLTLTAYSSAQSWDNLSADQYNEFTIKVANTEDGLRICEAGVLENGYLSCFSVTEKTK